MKRRIIAFVTAALLVFTGASVWEGSAAIAPNGALPDQGYYAATNSFPRNTVVDITNLETGKSVRVIVSGTLDTPGLLAVLSRDAAGIIGLQNSTIGRISMTQPSDPIAFSRFTEGRAANGDPDFDPEAMIASDSSASKIVPDVSYIPYNNVPSVVPLTVEDDASSNLYNEDEIVDITDFDEDAARYTAVIPPPVETDLWEKEPLEEDSPEVYTLVEPDYSLSFTNEFESLEADLADSSLPPKSVTEKSVSIVEEPKSDTASAVSPVPPVFVTEAITVSPVYDYDLVPAEERPPEEYRYYESPNEAPLTRENPVAKVETERNYLDAILNSPSAAPIEKSPELIAEAVPEILPLKVEPVNEPPVSSAVEPVKETPAAEPVTIFSVPLISSLERGKYYLQLGSYNRPESVETEISRIGYSYPIAVQKGGSSDKPAYRVLLGPVNLGESGALLQRFKGIGYKDAFVRSGS
jgi:hypothetical protein